MLLHPKVENGSQFPAPNEQWRTNDDATTAARPAASAETAAGEHGVGTDPAVDLHQSPGEHRTAGWLAGQCADSRAHGHGIQSVGGIFATSSVVGKWSRCASVFFC